MAGRSAQPSSVVVAALLMILRLLGAASLAAEELGEFSFEIRADGTPRFTQVIRWQADPNVLFYEVTLMTGAGEQVSVSRLEEPLLKLDLHPGEYRFQIVLYNLLGKPELELPWRSFTVRKADIPRITGLSPKVWYLEDLKPGLTISGEDLAPGATIVLSRADGQLAPITGAETQREGTGTVSVEFPVESLPAGAYSLVLTNPGGISSTLASAVIVRYRPVDFLFSGGFAPWVPLYDSWYTEVWPGPVFLLGAVTRFSVYFVKQEFGSIGVELEAMGRLMQGGYEGAVVSSEKVLAGVNGIYKLRFTPKIAGMAGIGGGIMLSHYSFDYAGTPGPEISSMDPYASAGLSIQYYLTKYVYLEAGVDWMQVFPKSFSEGGLTPLLCAGIQF